MYETARCSVRPLLAVVAVFEEAAALEEEAGFGSAVALALALALEGPAMGPEEEGDAARISGGKRAARALMPAVMASRLLRSTSFCGAVTLGVSLGVYERERE